MQLRKTIRNFSHSITETSKRFMSEVRGVAAVEFALIAPLMILLFLGTVEISYAIALDRKISRTASSIADLITQEFNFISEDAVAQIFSISSEIMQPYDSIPCIVVTGISITQNASTGANEASVAWSIDNTDTGDVNPSADCSLGVVKIEETARTARNDGDEFPVPTELLNNNDFLVSAEVFLPHTPIVGFAKHVEDGDGGTKLNIDKSVMNLNDVIFLRPRSGQEIELDDTSPAT